MAKVIELPTKAENKELDAFQMDAQLFDVLRAISAYIRDNFSEKHEATIKGDGCLSFGPSSPFLVTRAQIGAISPEGIVE